MSDTLIAVLAGAAAATTIAAAAGSTPFSDGRPPERFQSDRTLVIEMRDQAGISGQCQALFGKPPQGMKTNACYTGDKLIMPNPCSFPPTDTYAHMLCHELGHANGWPSTHGD